VRRSTITLWVISAVLVGAALLAILINPDRTADSEADDEMATTIAKAVTYYDFNHYDRAAETFRSIAEEGMNDPSAWYLYARSVELSSGLDIDLYMTAYEHLLSQGGDSEYLADTEDVLLAYAVPFEFATAADERYQQGDLVSLTGTVTAITWGRIESGRDLLRVDTRPDDWMGHLGDSVTVDMPRHRRFQVGDTIRVIGWYNGFCSSTDTGQSVTRPCILATGGRLVRL
jgi:hypothetical protein